MPRRSLSTLPDLLRWSGVTVAVVAVVGCSVVPIMAQTQEVVPTEPTPIETGAPAAALTVETQPVVSPSPMVVTPSLDAQIADVRATYRGQLEQYRTQERQYQIALDQYQRLGTLISLETAVSSTQQLMMTRARVLSTYTNLVRLHVVRQDGVDQAKKDELVTQMDQLLVELDNHQRSVELANDKIRVNALTGEFKPLGKRIEDTCYKALSFLYLGKLQVVYTKADALHEVIKIEESSSSAVLDNAQRDRAIAETERTFDQVSVMFKDIESLAYGEDITRAKSDNQRLREEAKPIYAGLNKILSFLEEILRLF